MPGPKASEFKEIWQDDHLSRWQDADLIRRFLLRQLDLRANAGKPRTFTLNLDSDWGSGKTFFLKRFQQQLTEQGHIAVYVNAWEDDHSKDPFLTVVTAIIAELEHVIEQQDGALENALERSKPLRKAAFRIVGGALVSGASHLAKRYVGEEAFSELAALRGPDADDAALEDALTAGTDKLVDGTGQAVASLFAHQKTARDDFQTEMHEVSQRAFETADRTPPVFVLIDELDRCRPTYAVELLERIKHLFGIENFVFILGSDTEQLSHAIRGLYGGEFDSKRYLKRFVDRTYTFQPVVLPQFVEHAFKQYGLTEEMFTLPRDLSAVGFLTAMFDTKGVELRDIEQIVEIISTFISIWPWDGLEIDLIYLLPIVYRKHYGTAFKIEDLPIGKPEDRFSQQLLRARLVIQSYVKPEPQSISLEGAISKINNIRASAGNQRSQSTFDDWIVRVDDANHNYAAKNNTPKTQIEDYHTIMGRFARLDSPGEGSDARPA